MRIVQCSCIGNFGRFANSALQFCFAKAYAEKYDAVLQIPEDWYGRKLFKNVENIEPIVSKLPKMELDYIPKGKVNIDLFGYFQHKEAFEFLSLEKIREYLQFKDEWIEMFPKKISFYIACHLRIGDYLDKYSHVYCIPSKKSYIQAIMKATGSTYESIAYGSFGRNTVFWISEENPQLHSECPYAFLPDFFTLMNADILFRANSTFSVLASILGQNETYSPLVEHTTGIANVEFVKGNWPKCLGSYGPNSKYTPSNFIFGKNGNDKLL